MKLKKIKVSGFKSFVDPTTLAFPSNVVGVVGPNGCGKSNIIDAIRWVMGEGSARNLRGDSMGDVIFNGASNRKPVGKASVELVFDNRERTISGPHGAFEEISIRRTLSRDAPSEYFLNNTRCRRRDIIDIFHGTGLGPRSYAIIEQGMVSRIVESRPEDLRVFVEETAGISRYKERRRETETRLRHTRENLQRVDDIRSELEASLRRLQRQAQSARRHQELKEQDRTLSSQLYAMRWQRLTQQQSDVEKRVRQAESDLENKKENMREQEQIMNTGHEKETGSHEDLNRMQNESYRINSEISQLEQRIEHERDVRARHQANLQRAREDIATLENRLREDGARRDDIVTELASLESQLSDEQQLLEQSQSGLQEARSRLQDWQARWDALASESQVPMRQPEVAETRIKNLSDARDELQQRLQEQLREQQTTTARLTEFNRDESQQALARHTKASAVIQQRLDEGVVTLDAQREEIDKLRQQLDDKHTLFREISERLASQRELQKSAMGGGDELLAKWLRESGLDALPRLATEVEVSDGWERAVEQLLAKQLPALCVKSLTEVGAMAGRPTKASAALGLVEQGAGTIAKATHGPGTTDKSAITEELPAQPAGDAAGDADASASLYLSHYVSCSTVALDEWLHGVYVTETVPQALVKRAQLARGQCVVTRDGVVVGRTWIFYPPSQETASGVLAREHLIEQLLTERDAVNTDIDNLKSNVAKLGLQRNELELSQTEGQRDLNRHASHVAELHSSLGQREGEVRQLREREQKLKNEIAQTQRDLAKRDDELSEAREQLQEASDIRGHLEDSRRALSTEGDALKKTMRDMENDANNARDDVHQTQLSLQDLRTSRDSRAREIDSNTELLQSMRQRETELLSEYQEDGTASTDKRQHQLDNLMQQRVHINQQLDELKGQHEKWANLVREYSQRRINNEQQLANARDAAENVRLEREKIVTLHSTLAEQIETLAINVKEALATLPDQATEQDWQQQLESVHSRIARIGPVNLVAIDEYEEHATRKEQLDAQAADLEQALGTLQNAIRKIDRETRGRFEETFNRINDGFRDFFPRLFGGGSASLALTGDDMLSAGVTVLARPPGKRNSTIYLLSGGEKALTAVALLFALFELNPAPFCMLDEVDAPLDDSNVERYCQTLHTLSSKTQLIFITHNKITMESADVLVGVTMVEPGVSRLVSVNVAEALEMAAGQ